MKRVLLILLITAFQGFSQTQGISYQAVILSPTAQEIPGVNAQGNILANSAVSIQFTIVDAAGSEEFQEYHTTSTDRYGMVNLLIGNGTATYNSFNDIVWDGTAKKLKVGIDFKGGSNYVPLSSQELTYMPSPVTQQTSQLIDSNTTSISEEVIRATAAETTLQTNINSLTSNVATNATTAATATAAVQADVNANETASNTANIILQNNINTVQTDVDANETASNTAIAAVQSDVDANESDSDAVDATHTTNIATNATNIAANTSANTTTQSDVDQNETAANTAIAGVQTNVNNNEAASNTADTILQSNIDALSTTANAAIDLKANIASPTFTGTVSGITSAMVGLGNLDNTSDINKPVSTATQTALDLKADKNNPIFTGNATIGADLNVGGNMAVNGGLFLNSWDIYTSNSIFSINESGVAPSFNIIPGGNVGIGNPSPQYNLDVIGQINATEGLYLRGDKIISNDGFGRVEFFDNTGIEHIELNEFVTNIQTVDVLIQKRLGIGGITPTANLEVAGTVKIVDGTQGLGKILTSDADGLASWKDAIVTAAKLAAVQTDVAANKTASDAADLTLTTNLATEVSRATTAEGVNAADIVAVQADVDKNELDAKIDAMMAQDDAMMAQDDAMMAHYEARMAQDMAAAVQADVALNKTASAAADLTLTTNLATEVSRATTAEGVNTAAIAINTAKTGITSAQASEITANTAKTVMTLGTTSTTALAGNTVTITPEQVSAIAANTSNVSWQDDGMGNITNTNTNDVVVQSSDFKVQDSGGYTNFRVTESGEVEVNNRLNVMGPASMSNLDVMGHASMNNLDVMGDASIVDLNVGSASMFFLDVMGDASIDDLNVGGSASAEQQPTEARHLTRKDYVDAGDLTNANSIATNTAAIANNTAKTGITSAQASEITANTAKVGQASGTTTGDMQYWNGTAWVVIATTPNEGAALQMISGVPTWIGGTLPPPPPTIGEATIGDLRDGGVVFWVDPIDNTHGLVCALSDYAVQVEWGCDRNDLSSVPNVAYNNSNPVGSGAEIGHGESNTSSIIANCISTSSALRARYNGAEWFLPSAKELNEIYINKATLEAVSGVVAFSSFYWSSSENASSTAWELNFSNGNLDVASKAFQNYVRAVRAF